MINYTRSFDLAWERMVTILFRPFSLAKWFVIGFSAFLAGLLSGGNNPHISFNQSWKKGNWSATYDTNVHQFNSHVSGVLSGLQAGALVLLGIGIFLIISGVIVLFYWLGARGQFLLLDNVVRNRGAIAQPWRAYARLGNSLFGFYLFVLLIGLLIFVVLTVLGVLVALPEIRAHRWPDGVEWLGIISVGIFYLAVVVALSMIIFLFRELGVPLMFRHGIFARAAFSETWKLIRMHPGSMAAFILLRMALFIALAILSLVTCCFCCLGVIPYISTVVILPAIIYIKCFSLDFLAQFGPEYNVWIVDVAPVAPTPTIPSPSPEVPPASPPPPLG